MTTSFGARLRAQRERKRIALASIAHDTKIKASLFDALERDDVSAWPSGIFRRAFIRAYAEAIGLDPEPVVREFLQRFPDPADESAGASPPRQRNAQSHDDRSEESPLRLTLDDSGSRFAMPKLRLLAGRWERVAAALCDIAIVLALGGVLFAAAGHFWTPFAIATVCYYFGTITVFRNTGGVWMIGRRRSDAPKPRALSSVPAQPKSRRRDAATVRPFEAREYDKAV